MIFCYGSHTFSLILENFNISSSLDQNHKPKQIKNMKNYQFLDTRIKLTTVFNILAITGFDGEFI